MKLSLMSKLSLVVGVVPGGLCIIMELIWHLQDVYYLSPPETRVKESLELRIFSVEVEAPIAAHGKEESPYCCPW